LQNINLNIKTQTIYNIANQAIQVLIILIVMFLIIKIGFGIINRFIEKQKNLKFSLDDRKSKTVGALLKSILKYSVYIFGVFAIIQVVLGNIGLTFAGIGGVAIGLGTQSVVKDVLNGFFILFEDQYSVGEYITIENKSGTVEVVELRVTRLKSENGDIYVIPNGQITKVTNHSRNLQRIMLEVYITEELDKSTEAIKAICSNFNCEKYREITGPKFIGISAYEDNYYKLRIEARVIASKKNELISSMIEYFKTSLDKKEIKTVAVKLV
jgi:moderate conductance mechanosensitive channel